MVADGAILINHPRGNHLYGFLDCRCIRWQLDGEKEGRPFLKIGEGKEQIGIGFTPHTPAYKGKTSIR
jgi:hypothetical protein